MAASSRQIDLKRSNGTSPLLKKQWVNWIIVLFLQFVFISGYWITLPSMHQFITNPKISILQETFGAEPVTEDLKILNTMLWPGLGESEYIYSWIIAAYSIGELVGSALAAVIATFLPYYITIPVSCLVHITAGVLYALAFNSTMLFISRFLSGVFIGVACVLQNSYIGESADIFEAFYDSMKNSLKQGESKESSEASQNDCCSFFKKKMKTRTRKDFLYILCAFISAVSSTLGLGIASLMAQFPSIHQFHWPGWYVVITTTIYAIVFLIAFEKPCNCHYKLEEDLDDHKFQTKKMNKKSSYSARKQHCCSMNLIKQIMIYSFTVLAGCVVGIFFTIMDTLVNPILSDQFGFTVADISYFVLAVVSLQILATIFLAIVKIFAIDNRAVLAGTICMAIVSGVLMSDWQAIGNDPCSSFCNHTNNLSDYSIVSNFEKSTIGGCNLSINLDMTSIEDLCKNASTSEHTCYWNPRSRITGKYCADCTERCNSTKKSLSFAQFCIGSIILIFVLQITNTIVNILASDYTPTDYQGIIIGVVYASNGVSRIISPIWSDWAYEKSNKHTFVVMPINTLTYLLLLVMLLVLYRQLAPKSYRKDESCCDSEDENDEQLQSHLLPNGY